MIITKQHDVYLLLISQTDFSESNVIWASRLHTFGFRGKSSMHRLIQ